MKYWLLVACCILKQPMRKHKSNTILTYTVLFETILQCTHSGKKHILVEYRLYTQKIVSTKEHKTTRNLTHQPLVCEKQVNDCLKFSEQTHIEERREQRIDCLLVETPAGRAFIVITHKHFHFT